MIKSHNRWLTMDDDVTTAGLMDTVKRHCKLVLEHGHRNTRRERREAIRTELERLRVERDSLLESFVEEDLH